MIKYYLVPAEGDGLSPETSFHPKFVDELLLNWSGVHLPDKNCFLITVNTKEEEKLSSIEKETEVIDLTSNTKESKALVEEKLELSKIDDNKDVFEVIGKTVDSDFSKDKLFVLSE